MPTYEYACRKCGHELEAVQSFTDEPLSTCPNCGGQLRKVFSAVGIVFKGSGFYKTDNRSSGSRASQAASEPATSTESATPKDSEPAKAASTTKEPAAAKESPKATAAPSSTPAASGGS